MISFSSLALFAHGGAFHLSDSLGSYSDFLKTISLVWSTLPSNQNLLMSCLIGELEPTLLQCFIQAAKLKQWLSRPECPDEIKECKDLFDKAYAPKSQDNAPQSDHGDEIFVEMPADGNEELPKDQQTLPSDLRHLVGSRKAVLHARHKRRGIIYSRSSTHLGNSLIHFHPKEQPNQLVPGSIKYIFSLQGRTAFAVRRQLPLTGNFIDPFAKWFYFPAKLYSPQLQEQLEIVELDSIFAHYARWDITDKLAVVLSLSRVCLSE
jgi:hypothetical protein